MNGAPGPTTNPRKTRGLRLLGQVDVAPLCAAALAAGDGAWAAEDAAKPNRFAALAAAQHIVFRFIDNPADWRRSHDRPAWIAWRDLLAPVLAAAVAPYGFTQVHFPRIMLAKLPPGGTIVPHVDSNPAARWPHKVHVPLATNPGVVSAFAGRRCHFPVGAAVEVDNLQPHWAANRGTTDRIHLIFECFDAADPGNGR